MRKVILVFVIALFLGLVSAAPDEDATTMDVFALTSSSNGLSVFPNEFNFNYMNGEVGNKTSQFLFTTNDHCLEVEIISNESWLSVTPTQTTLIPGGGGFFDVTVSNDGALPALNEPYVGLITIQSRALNGSLCKPLVVRTEYRLTADNPALENSCGVDMAIIIDSSGSIGAAKLEVMQSAFYGFVDAFLPNTPTEISVTDFDTRARILTNHTDNVTLLKDEINSTVSGGLTNWEQGFVKAHSLFDNRVDKPDLYVFASDGFPNRFGESVTPGITDKAVGEAMDIANQIKSDGARIIALGIGTSLNTDTLSLVSSQDDVILSNFSDLSTTLAELADELCRGSVIVRKTVNGTAASGFAFDVVAQNGNVTVINSITDANGFASFEIETENDTLISVIETLQQGNPLDFAMCVDEGNNTVGIFDGVDSVNNILVTTESAIFCTFENGICPDEDGDSVCDTDDMCPNTTMPLDVDSMGCDIFQFCDKLTCGPECFFADWKDNEQGVRYPKDCTVVVPLASGVHQQPICVPTVASPMCSG